MHFQILALAFGTVNGQISPQKENITHSEGDSQVAALI